MVFDRDPRGFRADAAPERHRTTHHLGGGDELRLEDIVALPAQGSILVAQAAGAGRYTYQEYAFTAPAANVRTVFGGDHGDVEPSYKTALDATLPVIVTPGGAGAAGTSLLFSHRDHDHPATNVANATTLSTLSATVNAFIALFYSNVVATNQQLTSNSTAFQNVTNMILPLTANQVWAFRMTIRYTSSVAADFKFQFTVPAGATLEFSSAAVLFGGVNTFLGSFGATTPAPADGIAAPLAIEVMGTITCAGTAGNLQLQAAQNTATVEATDFVLAGSNVTGRRVA